MNPLTTSSVFGLPRFGHQGLLAPLLNLASAGLEKLFALRNCETLYRQIRPIPGENFPQAVLGRLGIRYRVAETELQNIPASGPVVLVANHPFGGVEGLILMALLERIRPDVKFLANQLLMKIPELQGRLLPVDPFNQPGSARHNLNSMRRALQWVEAGNVLVIFPAGEVSSLSLADRNICDPAWNTAAARIVKRTGAPVVPVFFPGRNGLLFQAAGLLHPRLRTALLPRELLNKRNTVIELRVGGLIPAKRLREFAGDPELTAYLRARTYFLANAADKQKPVAARSVAAPQAAIIDPIAPELLGTEIERLPEHCHLAASGPFDVYLAEPGAIPRLLREIGRLREVTFREAGEGSGASLDLDPFDQYYQHLFIWQREKQEIVGAYRLGATDRILPQLGSRGLYTSTLFHYRPGLMERITPGLEMGRSFVRVEYQKSYSPLLLLWKGIGSYVARNPRYRYLFGPVSISRDYRDASRQLMTSSLSRHFLMDDLAALVEPRVPVSLKPIALKGCRNRQQTLWGETMEDIAELVADLEADRKGIPVLLRQYLNLGGRLLAFNLDPQFSDVVDGLILVDLLETEEKQLVRYLGRDGAAAFLTHHAANHQRIVSPGV
jgi:putative hemolysin